MGFQQSTWQQEMWFLLKLHSLFLLTLLSKAADDTLVDKSDLTGDSEMKVSATERHANPLESPNFVMAGSRLTSGSCDGIIVQVGKKTVWGRISGLGSTLEF